MSQSERERLGRFPCIFSALTDWHIRWVREKERGVPLLANGSRRQNNKRQGFFPSFLSSSLSLFFVPQFLTPIPYFLVLGQERREHTLLLYLCVEEKREGKKRIDPDKKYEGTMKKKKPLFDASPIFFLGQFP